MKILINNSFFFEEKEYENSNFTKFRDFFKKLSKKHNISVDVILGVLSNKLSNHGINTSYKDAKVGFVGIVSGVFDKIFTNRGIFDKAKNYFLDGYPNHMDGKFVDFPTFKKFNRVLYRKAARNKDGNVDYESLDSFEGIMDYLEYCLGDKTNESFLNNYNQSIKSIKTLSKREVDTAIDEYANEIKSFLVEG